MFGEKSMRLVISSKKGGWEASRRDHLILYQLNSPLPGYYLIISKSTVIMRGRNIVESDLEQHGNGEPCNASFVLYASAWERGCGSLIQHPLAVQKVF